MKHACCSKMIVAIAALMLCGSLSYGDTTVTPQTKFTGYTSVEAGQVVQGSKVLTPLFDNNSNYVILERIYAGANMQTLFNPLPIEGNVGFEMKAYRETPASSNYSSDQGQTSRIFYFPYITRADIQYTVNNSLKLQAGYFPFKYNENARNLGEYLFRTGSYPQYIISDFDFPMARVLGLHANGNEFDKTLNWDALLTANAEFTTIGDINLTGVVSYTPCQLLTIGGGVQFASLISAGQNTSPHVSSNAYVKSIHKTSDTTNDTSFGYYTFASTKLMGRIAIDLKTLFPDNLKSFCGAEDLKIYSEAAILGLKNYPGSLDSTTVNGVKSPKTRYDDIKKRIPVMIGINIPTYKILDILSFECEWFGSTDPNDMTQVVRDGIPSERQSSFSGTSYADSTRDNWKWSFYAKKTLAGHFNILAQIASDHLRWEYNGYADHANHDGIEALRAINKYYFIVRFGYNF